MTTAEDGSDLDSQRPEEQPQLFGEEIPPEMIEDGTTISAVGPNSKEASAPMLDAQSQPTETAPLETPSSPGTESRRSARNKVIAAGAGLTLVGAGLLGWLGLGRSGDTEAEDVPREPVAGAPKDPVADIEHTIEEPTPPSLVEQELPEEIKQEVLSAWEGAEPFWTGPWEGVAPAAAVEAGLAHVSSDFQEKLDTLRNPGSPDGTFVSVSVIEGVPMLLERGGEVFLSERQIAYGFTIEGTSLTFPDPNASNPRYGEFTIIYLDPSGDWQLIDIFNGTLRQAEGDDTRLVGFFRDLRYPPRIANGRMTRAGLGEDDSFAIERTDAAGSDLELAVPKAYPSVEGALDDLGAGGYLAPIYKAEESGTVDFFPVVFGDIISALSG